MLARQITDSRWFNAFILTVIVLNAGLIGWSTYLPDGPTQRTLQVVEWGCVWLFAVEIALRFAARDSTRAFLGDRWNVFDLLIVASAFVPATGGVGPVLRILRVFRVLRLVKAVPELRMIVDVLVRSVRSMKYIGLLAVILFYVYAVIGVKSFGSDGQPLAPYFATIHETCFTLFRILTGDDWTQMRYELAQAGGDIVGFTIYQVTWILIATFLLVNLIVGAIINNYQRVQEIEHNRQRAPDTSERRLRELVEALSAIMEARAHPPAVRDAARS